MTYKLIVLDLDGTLLRPDHSVSPANAAAVWACVAQGAQVVLASGRSLRAILPTAHTLRLDSPIIALNGSLIGDRHRGIVRARHQLDAAQLPLISAVLLERAVPFVVFGTEQIYALADMPQRDDLVAYGEPLATVVPALTHEHIADPLKVLAFLPPSPLDAELSAALEPAVAQVRTGRSFLEWLPHAATKGDALLELMAEQGIAREEVIAIGDGYNDLSMFAVAGLSVAMGDAVAEVREHAAVLTAGCEEDGVALALQRYVLG
jgi:Cof subfamily protein (haloacid dehalogenase superfamily)